MDSLWKLWRTSYAARTIQETWRRISFRKVFLFYQDLISSVSQVSPKKLLNTVAPNDSQIFDKSLKYKIRLRLGGAIFPPTLLYKIFVSEPVCNIGNFAPRDYTSDDMDFVSSTKFNNDFTSQRRQGIPGHIKVGRKSFKVNIHSRSNFTNLNSIPPGWLNGTEDNQWRPVHSNVLGNFIHVEMTRKKQPVVKKQIRISSKCDCENLTDLVKWTADLNYEGYLR